MALAASSQNRGISAYPSAVQGIVAGYLTDPERILLEQAMEIPRAERDYLRSLMDTNPQAANFSNRQIEAIELHNLKLSPGLNHALCHSLASFIFQKHASFQYHALFLAIKICNYVVSLIHKISPTFPQLFYLPLTLQLLPDHSTLLLSKLESLNLTGVHLTEHELATILTFLPGLKCLKLDSSCAAFSTPFFQNLGYYCPNLVDLDLSSCAGITDRAITALVQNCRHLTRINLSHCWHITNTAITSIATHYPQLTGLHLKGCLQVTDEGIASLGAHCPLLTHLTLSKCWMLTAAAITTLATRCSQLTHLDLYDCFELTDAAITALATHSTQLTHLNLGGCWKLTDTAINTLVTQCTQLSYLDLARCRNLTDEAIISIATHCSQLTHLNLSRCHQITLHTINTLITLCPQLNRLDLYNWWGDGLPDAFINVLKAAHPDIDIRY